MTTTHRFTILGCGSSGGVPRIDGNWGACDPANPKNRRRRCSLLIQQIGQGGTTTVLVDTGPDMREQLLSARAGYLDAVVYTHSHADHLHGIDDLRGLALATKRRVPVYMDRATRAHAEDAFGYCFHGTVGYPPILDAHDIEPGQPVVVDGAGGALSLMPFTQVHGRIESLGWRVGNVAYSSDLNDVPETSLPYLDDLDVWIVDALRFKDHSSHFSVYDALEWLERVRAKRGVLTNLHQDLDYDALTEQLPPNVEPAYDMMVLEFSP